MSVARRNVYERLSATRRAINDFSLQDLPLLPANISYNNSVRIIRNGLAVQCFNILEDFARARTAEILSEISSSAVQFQYLPEALQRAATNDVVGALGFQTRLLEKSQRISYAQMYGAKIASTNTVTMQLAEIAFFHASSNISKENFRDALAAFSIETPWDQITGLCSRSGLSALPANTVFESLAQRRHWAAHNASAAVSEGDLLQSITDAFGLAIGFDILLSKASKSLVNLISVPPSNYKSITSHLNIPLRFIKPITTGFAEVREGATRNTRRNVDHTALLRAASIRALRENGALVVFDAGNNVLEWYL